MPKYLRSSICSVLLLAFAFANSVCAWAESSQPESLGERAALAAKAVFDRADRVHYEHRHLAADEQVQNEQNGYLDAATDCSGFISYIVRTVAPKHYKAIESMQPSAPYPQAKIWARFFGSLSSEEARDGWIAVASYRDLRRGDFIAWKKGDTADDHGGHGNTGHVMMVYDTPGPAQSLALNDETLHYVSVRVIDASSVYHFAPEELPPNAHQSHRDGLGIGSVRIILSETGQPIGYWEGTYWGEGHKEINSPKLSPDVRFARIVGLRSKR